MFFLSVILNPNALAQQQIQIENGDLTFSQISESDQFYWLYKNETGQVLIKQDDVTLESDSTQYYQSKNFAKALGNVYINQNDSIEIFSSEANYNGQNGRVVLIGEVALNQDIYTLQTTRLDYDTRNKIASYNNGGTLVDTSSILTSIKGRYNTDTRQAHFTDSVVLDSPERKILTDDLTYNLDTKRAEFTGPTTIIEEGRTVTTTKGWYNTETGEAEFTGSPVIEGDDLDFKAQSVVYSKDGQSLARGNVYYFDKEKDIELWAQEATRMNNDEVLAKGAVRALDRKNNVELLAEEADLVNSDIFARENVRLKYPEKDFTLLSDTLNYYDETGLIESFGRPFLSTFYEGDSVYVSASSIIGHRIDTLADTTYNFIADKNVLMYRSDIQAIADSAYINGIDSLLTLHKKPVVWNDSSQMSADTIRLFTLNRKMDRMEMRTNSFIVNLVEKQLHNQVKGKTVDAYFADEDIDYMIVNGNAETIYYVQDDSKAFVGINEMKCGKIRVQFGDGKMEEIFWLNRPVGSTHPFQDVNPGDFVLDGFAWRELERPKGRLDILRKIGRGKVIAEELTTEGSFPIIDKQ